ncbi:hypothetical protein [Enterococcus hirae]|uniref:hypothetical protein n=1 Tax=Enterococcus hirae TaxID=1354 RepID=UPI0039A64E9D
MQSHLPNQIHPSYHSTTKTKLIDDVMPDYYYLAEVQEAPTFEEAVRFGTLTVKFQCYPFRISESLESNASAN